MTARRCASVLASLLLAASTAARGGDPCPEKLQAVMLIKVLRFTEALGSQGANGVVVGVYGGSDAVIGHLKQAATASGDRVDVTRVDGENLDLAGVQVLYVARETGAAVVERLSAKAKERHVLSVGGDSAFVERHRLAVGFEVVDERPRVVINRAAASAEGARFSARLMQLADLR